MYDVLLHPKDGRMEKYRLDIPPGMDHPFDHVLAHQTKRHRLLLRSRSAHGARLAESIVDVIGNVLHLEAGNDAIFGDDQPEKEGQRGWRRTRSTTVSSHIDSIRIGQIETRPHNRLRLIGFILGDRPRVAIR